MWRHHSKGWADSICRVCLQDIYNRSPDTVCCIPSVQPFVVFVHEFIESLYTKYDGIGIGWQIFGVNHIARLEKGNPDKVIRYCPGKFKWSNIPPFACRH